jgi:hypothetical protein
VIDQQTNETIKVTPTPEASFAAAFYPAKEAWKDEPGSRYTPEELRQMDRNWDIQIINPDAIHCRSAD